MEMLEMLPRNQGRAGGKPVTLCLFFSDPSASSAKLFASSSSPFITSRTSDITRPNSAAAARLSASAGWSSHLPRSPSCRPCRVMLAGNGTLTLRSSQWNTTSGPAYSAFLALATSRGTIALSAVNSTILSCAMDGSLASSSSSLTSSSSSYSASHTEPRRRYAANCETRQQKNHLRSLAASLSTTTLIRSRRQQAMRRAMMARGLNCRLTMTSARLRENCLIPNFLSLSSSAHSSPSCSRPLCTEVHSGLWGNMSCLRRISRASLTYCSSRISKENCTLDSQYTRTPLTSTDSLLLSWQVTLSRSWYESPRTGWSLPLLLLYSSLQSSALSSKRLSTTASSAPSCSCSDRTLSRI
mmetsp:Transcript_9516/g.31847  ORF Transcript_9516/g.31847 Transcript_9516/m.31847 type:complete len:356 (-) Transcript_9516:334-1401(-)